MIGAFGETLEPVKISRFKVGDKFMTPKGISVITNITPDKTVEIVNAYGSYEWKRIRTDTRRGEYVDLGRGLYAKDKIK